MTNQQYPTISQLVVEPYPSEKYEPVGIIIPSTLW